MLYENIALILKCVGYIKSTRRISVLRQLILGLTFIRNTL